MGVPAALLAGWAVELPYVGRKGTLAIASGECQVSFKHLHYSTTPREIKGSPAHFCSPLPLPEPRINSWHGIADTCSSAMSVLDHCVYIQDGTDCEPGRLCMASCTLFPLKSFLQKIAERGMD